MSKLPRIALLPLGLLLLATACSSGGGHGGSSANGSVAPPPAALTPPSPDESTSTTVVSAGDLVLAADGLGPLPFGTQAARSLEGLTQALGRAETPTVIPPETACGATRRFGWKGFDVLLNEVNGRAAATIGLVGWSLAAPAPVDLKTDKGIGIGSTTAALKAAYGPAVNVAGATFTITTASGVIKGDLDGVGAATHVKALRAGVSCTG